MAAIDFGRTGRREASSNGIGNRVLNRLFKCRMSKRRGGVCPKCKGKTPFRGAYPPPAPCWEVPRREPGCKG